ncbi:MAG: type II secretion system F family protein [Clostridiales bacterium]|nr:type II secretion system F family protein [Clostridiales bacterium]
MDGTVSGTSHEFYDYNNYRMSKPEACLSAAAAMAAVFVMAYVFYRSLLLSALLAPFGLFYLPRRRKQQILRRRDALKQQFRDMLYSLSSSLMAGKTMESALREVRGDLEILYPDPETAIIREVDVILRRITLNETIDLALKDLAERSGIEDIESFCNVLVTCRRTGGNLVEIVKNTTNILGDKMEIKNEIDVLLAQRKFEKKVLNAMPIALILVLSMTAKDYIDPVFTTLTGRLIMSAALLLIAFSWFVSERIMNIKV